MSHNKIRLSPTALRKRAAKKAPAKKKKKKTTTKEKVDTAAKAAQEGLSAPKGNAQHDAAVASANVTRIRKQSSTPGKAAKIIKNRGVGY